MKPIIAIAFDGACMTSSTLGDLTSILDVVEGTPTKGLFEFVEEISPNYEICIVSPRCRTVQGREAVRDWLEAAHIEWRGINNKPPKDLGLVVSEHLPDYILLIDPKSNAIKDGTWPRMKADDQNG